MPVLALGVSYRRAPVRLLERLVLADEDFPKAYHHLSTLESVNEAVIVSTCNRVEVYADVASYHEGFKDLKRFLTDGREVPAEELAEPLYSHYEDHAAEHLFSVASGIDSMVVGEPQILLQVQAARRRAEAEGTAGPVLQELFHHAARTGRAGPEGDRGGGRPRSFVEAGAVVAAEHLHGLSGRSLLVIGAGEMSAMAVRTLTPRGLGPVRVLNRTPRRAERLAAEHGAGHGSLEDLRPSLDQADLVVCSTGSTGPVVTREDVEAAAPRPRFFLDLAVPRDVEPGVREVADQAVADIDDLRSALTDAADGNEVAAVRAIVAEEVARHAARRRAARLAPVIQALRDHGDRVRADELDRLAGRLSRLSERDRDAVETLTRGIVNKLLHQPVVALKRPGGEDLATVLAELFGLKLPD